MPDDLSRRRLDLLASKMQHPQGNRLTPDETLEYLVGTAETVASFLAEEDAEIIRAELSELRADYEMSCAARDALAQRIRSLCETVGRYTALPGQPA